MDQTGSPHRHPDCRPTVKNPASLTFFFILMYGSDSAGCLYGHLEKERKKNLSECIKQECVHYGGSKKKRKEGR